MINLLLCLTTFLVSGDIVNIAKEKQIYYNVPNKKYVVVIDYSKPIDSERLYVVDMKTSTIVLKSIVSHARNSGIEYAVNYSNEVGTLKSSLGCYKTSTTYYGDFGYSLIIKGLDRENSNAEKRHIIFHSNKKVKSKWSWGCFATPESINRKLINMIKDGCLVVVVK